jgi:hypothetical protein
MLGNDCFIERLVLKGEKVYIDIMEECDKSDGFHGID